MRRHRRRPSAWWGAAIIGLSMCGARAVEADISGWWRMQWEHAPAQFVEVTQTGVDVTLTFAGNTYSGALINGRLMLSGPVPSGNSSCDGGFLGGAVRDRDRRLYGGFFEIGLGCVGPFGGTLVGQRCECFDENEQDGDGCDASCQIEPCVTCSGDPPVCSPTPDGGVCDDRRDCTTGETCTGGTCGGGVPVDPCFDLSGPWRCKFDYGDAFEPIESLLRLEQRDGYAVIVTESGIGSNGPIDLATGAFHLSSAPLHLKDYFTEPFCLSETIGRLNAGGQILEGSVSAFTWTMRCGGFSGTVTGRRCRSESCSVCTGDCDDDGQVVIGELMTSVNIALERAPLDQCATVDTDESGTAEVNELTTAVNRLLHGCD